MKGIILAGGSGTRLSPSTAVVSKQLLPVYDKPMIYYPLSTLMLAGIRDILIVSTPADLPRFKQLLGDGENFGVQLRYVEQPKPEGIAQALILARPFFGSAPCALILGDNIFYGSGLSMLLRKAAERSFGATVFAYRVSDPERFGVVEFDDKRVALSIEEKPSVPKSQYAVAGLYFYDSKAYSFAEALVPSHRGELEITDLNQQYLSLGELRVEAMGRGFAWLDSGTHDSLLEASVFVEALQKRQGMLIGCPEEVAYNQQWISRDKLSLAASRHRKNHYGLYLQALLKGDE